jgi:hypothetical protein
VAGRLAFQDAAEHRLVEAELFLDRLGGQADLPADMAFTLCAASVDQAELDAIRLVERQAIEPFRREIYAALACGPETVDRGLFVECHR